MSDQRPSSLSRLTAGNPVVPDDRRGDSPEAQAALERILASEPLGKTAGRPSRRRFSRFPVRLNRLAPILTVLLAVVVALVFLRVGGSVRSGSSTSTGSQLVYQATPTTQGRVTRAALERAVSVMRRRVDELGVPGTSIRAVGANEISVRVPPGINVATVEFALDSSGRLEFYDWETNVLTAKGQTVAQLLARDDRAALAISQGTATGGPGGNSAASGALDLYQAVKLASEQPSSASVHNASLGTEYFLFGGAGSKACAAIATATRTPATPGAHCLLAGPVQTSGRSSRATALNLLDANLSTTEQTGSQILAIKPGTTVLQAVPSSFSKWPADGTATAGYYVLKDNLALSSTEITNPQLKTDTSGAPDVTFGFTSTGASAFQKLTAAIAERGQELSTGNDVLQQHFAIAIGNELVEVAYIDYKSYPDGVSASQGAEITGNFTKSSAKNIANQLRRDTLPLNLQLISSTA
jgi:preprotein translocase subunit SecD